MAQFRGTLQGCRGEASRLGSKASGLRATVHGWTAGLNIYAYHNPRTGEDVFEVREDGGSGHRAGGGPIVTIRHGPGDAEPSVTVHTNPASAG